jgi:RimJ/RimL family protein N-acetyltransferase
MDYDVMLACKEDAKAMLEYLKTIGSETDFLLFDSSGVPMTVEQEENFLDSVNKTEFSKMFLVKDNDLIIGNAYIHSNPRERIKHKAEIAISVLKEYWGKGVGSLLMKTLIDYAKSTGFTETIYLEVVSENVRAIKLYEEHGFVTYGINKKAIKINEKKYYDWNLMRLDL